MNAGSSAARRPAAFLDRDGVLIEDDGFVWQPQDVRWRPGVVESIRLLNDAGYLVFVVTNQSGVAQGYFSETDVVSLHGWMAGQLATEGAHIDAFYYCPHHPEGVVPEYRRVC